MEEMMIPRSRGVAANFLRAVGWRGMRCHFEKIMTLERPLEQRQFSR